MPILLPANQPPNRFYRGGARIADFRASEPPSIEPRPEYQPEDWVASTTACHGCRPLGLTVLPGTDTTLADAVAADPQHWLGPAHVAAFGADAKLLVKLLDAGQQLPVHAHPDGAWARRHVPRATCGKAEAWYVLTRGRVHLGLQADVAADALAARVQTQTVDALLPQMHALDVAPGDTVYVPPGTLHAIGEGLLVVEVQEPSDLSVLLEWRGFAMDGAALGHLGVGWPTALTAVDRRGRSRAEIEKLVIRAGHSAAAAAVDDGPQQTLVEASQTYFRLERYVLSGSTQTAPPGFAVLLVIDGTVELAAQNSPALSLVKGNTVVVAFADGELRLQGSGHVLIARPPHHI